MFTLKHITPYGNEMLYETNEVIYLPLTESVPSAVKDMGPLTGQLWYASKTTGQHITINDGHVFVMNDHGSTVAKYDLGGWASPTTGSGMNNQPSGT